MVDDDPDCCAALAFMLGELGYECRTCPSGGAALQAMASEQFDLSFVDIMMPGMNGFELLKLVRESPQHSNLPVIVLTARDTDDDLIAGYQGGADYYMTKPFNVSQVRYGVSLLLSPEDPAV